MDKEKVKEKKPINSTAIIISVIAVIAVVVIGTVAFLLGVNQSKCHGVVGTWTIEGDMMGVYEFKSNGSGGYGMGNFMLPFVYKDNGSYLLISADRGKTWNRTDYKIEDFGNRLMLTEDDGRTTTYTCTE